MMTNTIITRINFNKSTVVSEEETISSLLLPCDFEGPYSSTSWPKV